MANDAVIAKWQRVYRERPDLRERATTVLAGLGAKPDPESQAVPAQPASLLAAQQQRQGSSPPVQMGPTGGIGDAIGGFGRAILDQFTDPQSAGNVGARSALDAFSGNAYSDVTDRARLSTPEKRAEGVAKHPVAATVGTVAGTVAGAATGPAKVIQQGAQNLVSRAIPKAVGEALPMTRNLAANVIAGGAQGFAASGGDPEAAGMSALAAGGTGAALDVAGEAVEPIGRIMRGTRGGQQRQLVDQHAAEFQPGGRLAGKNPTDHDIGETSRQSAVNILKRIEDTRTAEKAPHSAEMSSLDDANQSKGWLTGVPGADAGRSQIVLADDLVAEFEALARHGRLNDAQQGAVRGALSRLTKWGRQAEDGSTMGPYLMPADELNAFRGMLNDSTETGFARTVPEALQGKAAARTRELGDTTDYGPPNAGIHEAHSKAEAQRRLLGLGDKPSGSKVTAEADDVSATEAAQVMNMMARDKQNTVTAGGRNGDMLRRLGREFPGHADDLAMPRVLDAKGDLQFRLAPGNDRHGLIERLKDQKGSAMSAAGGFLLGPQIGMNPVTAGALGLGANLLRLNAPAIQGRILYTPAQLAEMAAQAAKQSAPMAGALVPPLMNPLDALRARQAQEKRR